VAISLFTQQHDTLTRIIGLNHVWEGFLKEKADFSKLYILLFAIALKTKVMEVRFITVDRTYLMQKKFCEKQISASFYVFMFLKRCRPNTCFYNIIHKSRYDPTSFLLLPLKKT